MELDEVWTLQAQNSNELLGIFSTRDNAIAAGSYWLEKTDNGNSFSIKAIVLDELLKNLG